MPVSGSGPFDSLSHDEVVVAEGLSAHASREKMKSILIVENKPVDGLKT